MHVCGNFWVHVCGNSLCACRRILCACLLRRLGAKYAVVGCIYMETFGCMYADFGCKLMERVGACMRLLGAKYAVVGCKVCGCWVHNNVFSAKIMSSRQK